MPSGISMVTNPDLSSILESQIMQHLVDAVRKSVSDKNWYAALTVALTLPDIAAKLDCRQGGSGARYVSWFNDYLLPVNTVHYMGEQSRVFLSGEDCYALRCAFLHEGDFEINGQKIRQVLDRFHFVVPKSGTRHRNLFNTGEWTILELQVDMFCKEVCEAIERWIIARTTDATVSAALERLPLIDFS